MENLEVKEALGAIVESNVREYYMKNRFQYLEKKLTGIETALVP